MLEILPKMLLGISQIFPLLQYRSIITSFLHAWHHVVFCVYGATLSRGKLNFHKTRCGISTRRDVVFPRDVGFTQDMAHISTRHSRGISSKTGRGTYKRTSRENPREFLWLHRS